jgi:solute carrier family 10 (sodium/bile acid cotransporter), member 7
MDKIGLDWFIFAIGVMMALAYFWPEPGIYEGPFSLSKIATYGVSLIFFFYGLKLNPEQLMSGLKNWKLHIVIQLSTFLLFPCIVLIFYPMFEGTESEKLWLGTFYMAALPSTVSSSVVMVSIAGGNLPAAIFNASISSLAGIFITPLWMGIFIASGSADLDMAGVFGKLILQVLVPVILGLILHKWWGNIAIKYRQRLKLFDQAVILTIIYTSFSGSFARGMFTGIETIDLLLLGAVLLLIFFLVFGIMQFLSYILKLNREDRITTIFCGSKKSLVHGTVMSKILFPDANVVGIMLLPIMIYHAMQLIISSVLARSMAKK